MEFIGHIFWTIVLIGIILIGFGMLTGVKIEPLIRTYANFAVQMIAIVGDLLAKLAVPIVKQIGEKIVYVSQHYLNKNKPQAPSIPPASGQNAQQTMYTSSEPEPEPNPVNTPKHEKPAKAASANPYDDPPQPEIMD